MHTRIYVYMYIYICIMHVHVIMLLEQTQRDVMTDNVDSYDIRVSRIPCSVAIST